MEEREVLDFPKYEYSGRLFGDRKSLKAIPAKIYPADTISQYTNPMTYCDKEARKDGSLPPSFHTTNNG